ncbi:MAG: hypothetical protein WCW62_02155 [Bacteroidales bacterium]
MKLRGSTPDFLTLYSELLLMIILLPGIFLIGCSSSSTNSIIIENSCFRYEIAPDGKNLQFTDLASGKNYLDTTAVSWCGQVIQDGKQLNVKLVQKKGKHLRLAFGEAEVTADILIKKEKDRISFKVSSVEGNIESLTFLNIPLTLEGMPYEPFAACVLSMNLFTHVRELPALQSHLWATCYKRFGLKGAEITVLSVPQEKILSVIREVMSKAKDIPHSDKGGAWALLQEEGFGSYLMNFGTLTESTVDEWIKMCRSLGFNQIDSHGGGGFFKFGDFELDTVKWPGGWDAFRRINDRLHAAGISSIFHTYAFFIDKNSRYVTPVPSKDLGYFSTFTLTEPIKEGDTVLVVNEPTKDISTTTGFFVRNSLSLRIGDEIIEFSGVTQTPPYKFTGCKRGRNGTKVSSYDAGEKAFHLREMFGRFVPGPETPLFNEVAGRTAQIVSDYGFDGIYFDAIDGSDILDGPENSWYYGTKFVFEVARQLKHPVGMEMSAMWHHFWQYRSRWQAWDRPVRGYKRFIDVHSAAIKSARLFLPPKIKSNEYEHGLWRGHTPMINKYAPAENGGLLLPLHLGWWGNQTWNPPQVEPTFPDDIEYLCCKMIGNNAGLSMLGGADEKNLEANPLFRRLIAIIRQYEELRHQNYFNDTVRALLRLPGKEFTLFRQDNGVWNFKPIACQKHKVAGNGHPTSQWIMNNEFDSQPVKLRIEPLMSVTAFDDPSNVVLAGFTGSDEFKNQGNAPGVSGGIKIAPEKPKGGGASGLFTASASETSLVEGMWIKMEKRFEPWLDIRNNQALGVWIKGDGKGQLLNLRIESPAHISFGARGDHFVKIDFTGWKYFELVEIESSEFSNYTWPDSGFYVYDSFRHTVAFNSVDKLQLWYNNLPAGEEVNCLIGTIKALPLVPVSITDPCISVGGQKLTFPVKMESGMYLEFFSQNDCKLYGPKGEFIQDVRVEGTVPALKNGVNEISFSCTGPHGVSSRVQVTMVTEGKPLGT